MTVTLSNWTVFSEPRATSYKVHDGVLSLYDKNFEFIMAVAAGAWLAIESND